MISRSSCDEKGVLVKMICEMGLLGVTNSLKTGKFTETSSHQLRRIGCGKIVQVEPRNFIVSCLH